MTREYRSNLDKSTRKVIDLATTISETSKADTVYICPSCKKSSGLLRDRAYKQTHPHAGDIVFLCLDCGKHFDFSLTKLRKKPSNQKSQLDTVDNDNGYVQTGVPICTPVPENKGFVDDMDDEYNDLNQVFDPYGDELARGQTGGSITYSAFTVTDTNGNTRTVEKRTFGP